jgi:hypothetical protein
LAMDAIVTPGLRTVGEIGHMLQIVWHGAYGFWWCGLGILLLSAPTGCHLHARPLSCDLGLAHAAALILQRMPLTVLLAWV